MVISLIVAVRYWWSRWCCWKDHCSVKIWFIVIPVTSCRPDLSSAVFYFRVLVVLWIIGLVGCWFGSMSCDLSLFVQRKSLISSYRTVLVNTFTFIYLVRFHSTLQALFGIILRLLSFVCILNMILRLDYFHYSMFKTTPILHLILNTHWSK